MAGAERRESTRRLNPRPDAVARSVRVIIHWAVPGHQRNWGQPPVSPQIAPPNQLTEKPGTTPFFDNPGLGPWKPGTAPFFEYRDGAPGVLDRAAPAGRTGPLALGSGSDRWDFRLPGLFYLVQRWTPGGRVSPCPGGNPPVEPPSTRPGRPSVKRRPAGAGGPRGPALLAVPGVPAVPATRVAGRARGGRAVRPVVCTLVRIHAARRARPARQGRKQP